MWNNEANHLGVAGLNKLYPQSVCALQLNENVHWYTSNDFVHTLENKQQTTGISVLSFVDLFK